MKQRIKLYLKNGRTLSGIYFKTTNESLILNKAFYLDSINDGVDIMININDIITFVEDKEEYFSKNLVQSKVTANEDDYLTILNTNDASQNLNNKENRNEQKRFDEQKNNFKTKEMRCNKKFQNNTIERTSKQESSFFRNQKERENITQGYENFNEFNKVKDKQEQNYWNYKDNDTKSPLINNFGGTSKQNHENFKHNDTKSPLINNFEGTSKQNHENFKNNDTKSPSINNFEVTSKQNYENFKHNNTKSPLINNCEERPEQNHGSHRHNDTRGPLINNVEDIDVYNGISRLINHKIHMSENAEHNSLQERSMYPEEIIEKNCIIDKPQVRKTCTDNFHQNQKKHQSLNNSKYNKLTGYNQNNSYNQLKTLYTKFGIKTEFKHEEYTTLIDRSDPFYRKQYKEAKKIQDNINEAKSDVVAEYGDDIYASVITFKEKNLKK